MNKKYDSDSCVLNSHGQSLREEFVEFSVRDGGYLNVEIAACGVSSDSDVILVLHREHSTE